MTRMPLSRTVLVTMRILFGKARKAINRDEQDVHDKTSLELSCLSCISL
jgi:hypothetical protein